MTSGPPSDPDPTLHDLPSLLAADRTNEARTVRESLASDDAGNALSVYACCESCGASAYGWRRHLGDRIADGEGGVPRLAYDGACGVCGGPVVELHADAPRGRPRVASS